MTVLILGGLFKNNGNAKELRFESPNLQGTGAGVKKAGVGRRSEKGGSREINDKGTGRGRF